MKNIITITLAILIITFTSCDKKEEPSLPVHDPGRIVTCKIDGVPWSHGCVEICQSLTADYHQGFEKISFQAENNLVEPYDNSFSILFWSDGEFAQHAIRYNDFISGCHSSLYNIDTSYTHYFKFIEQDTIIRKIRGEFEFRAVNIDCQDTVLITDGYFDIDPIWFK